MDEREYRPYLSSLLYIVLYRPHYDVESVEFARQLRAAHSPEQYAILVASLEWVTRNPDYPLDSLLPDARMPNEEIRRVFTGMLAAMKAV